MLKSINPHQPSDVIGEFEETGQGGVEEAVARARELAGEDAGREPGASAEASDGDGDGAKEADEASERETAPATV